MKNIRNANQPVNADLVQVYLQSSWDIVTAVYAQLANIEEVADAIAGGTLDDYLSTADIDTIAKLNAILTDATLGDFATQAEAEAGVSNTKTMTPLRVAQAIAVLAAGIQNNFNGMGAPTVTDDADAGYTAGSVWIDTSAAPNESYRCADPTAGAAIWLKTTLTADELALVALSGSSDDLVEGVTQLLMTAAERSKLIGIESNATADMTGAEIKAAYEAEADTNAYTNAEKASNAASLKDSEFPAEGLMRATNGAGSYVNIKTNFAATVAPTVTDDVTAGYSLYSPWIDTVADKLYFCLDPAAGAAVWQEVGAGGGGGGGGLTPVFKTANYTASAGEKVYCDSSGGSFTITLPATPSDADNVQVVDAAGAAGAFPITVGRNGETINGDAEDFVIDQDFGDADFAYDGTGTDWKHGLDGSPDIVFAASESCLLQQMTGQSVGSGVFSPFVRLSFAEALGSRSDWWVVGSPTKITVDAAGLYLVTASVFYGNAGITERDCIIMVFKNSDGLDDLDKVLSHRYRSQTNLEATISGTLSLADGDWLEVGVYHASGAARTTDIALTHFAVTRLT